MTANGQKLKLPKYFRKQKRLRKLNKRAQYYKNLFDVELGFMRPRQNGGFVSPFKPNEVTFHFTEGNSWGIRFSCRTTFRGLIELHGGRANFSQKLSELFETEDKLAGREQPDITGLDRSIRARQRAFASHHLSF